MNKYIFLIITGLNIHAMDGNKSFSQDNLSSYEESMSESESSHQENVFLNNFTCHNCRISSQRKSKYKINYISCPQCKMSFCSRARCTKARNSVGSKGCLVCLNSCCCTYTLCPLEKKTGHKCCHTYSRTKKRHKQNTPSWSKKKKAPCKRELDIVSPIISLRRNNQPKDIKFTCIAKTNNSKKRQRTSTEINLQRSKKQKISGEPFEATVVYVGIEEKAEI